MVVTVIPALLDALALQTLLALAVGLVGFWAFVLATAVVVARIWAPTDEREA